MCVCVYEQESNWIYGKEKTDILTNKSRTWAPNPLFRYLTLYDIWARTHIQKHNSSEKLKQHKKFNNNNKYWSFAMTFVKLFQFD